MRLITAREQWEMLWPWRIAQDAYDPNVEQVMRPMYDPPKSWDTPWYHTSDQELPVGAELAPHKINSPWQKEYDEREESTRPNWVWLEHQPWRALGWQTSAHPHFYEVKPHEGPYPWNGSAGEGWVAPRATVVREVSRDEMSQLADEDDQ